MRLSLLVCVGVAAATIASVAYGTDALRRLDLDTVDARFDIRGSRPVPKNVVVVAIDDVTFSEMGVHWPFPRVYYARLLDRLRRTHPAAIALDLQFTEATSAKQDLALYEAVGRAHPVVLSTTETGPHGETKILGGDENLRRVSALPGMSIFPTDPDGVIRRMPRQVRKLASFALRTAALVRNRPIDSRALDGRGAWIDFHGPQGTFETISFSRALAQPASRFRDKVVVLGATAPSLQDVHATSAPGGRLMSGPELQANAISTALAGFPLRDGGRSVELALIVALAAAITLVSALSSALRAVPVALVLLAALAIGAQIAFDNGRVVSVVYPALSLVLTTAGTVTVDFLTERRDRRRLRAQFSRFVGDQVLTSVIEEAGDDLRLGGKQMDATVLFSDLRGFTSFTDQNDPAAVIEVLNRYLSDMSEAILDQGGTLVSYMGDGIMAVFGAPVAQPDHADRALAAAEEMLGPRLGAFNDWTRARGIEAPFRMGVGLNSGPVTSGNVGSERRLEYTTLGDTTNVASRLESKTKELGQPLLMSDSTRQRLSNGDRLEHAGELDIRGKAQAVEVWTTAPG